MLPPELKKGSAVFLVLSRLEHERRHGDELGKLIESRSKGVAGVGGLALALVVLPARRSTRTNPVRVLRAE